MTEKDDKQFDRAVSQIMKKKARKSAGIWIFIIFIVAILISLFVNYIPIFYDKLIHYNDPTYRPMDLERQYQELQDLRKDRGQKGQ
jgi:uncharacterized membrane protein SpoIIM required for sporulation